MNRNARSRVLVISTIILNTAIAQSALAQSNGSADSSPYIPDTPGESHASTDLRVFGSNPDGWLFPATKLDELLPS